MAWQIADDKPLERPVSLPPKEQHIGHTTAEWFESEPGIAVIMCEGGTIDDQWLARVVVREQLAACGIKQAAFTFDQSMPDDVIHIPQVSEDKRHSEDTPYMYHVPTNRLYVGDHGAYHRTMFYHPDLEPYGQELHHARFGNGWMKGRFDPQGVQHYDAYDIRNERDAEMLQPYFDKIEGGVSQYLGNAVGQSAANRFQDLPWDKLGHTKLADWNDIMAKAKRLIQSGNVTLLRNGYNMIVAHVIGDHGEYQTEVSRDDPNSRVITQWTCECPWDQFAFQRTRKWKKYEARPCAHVLAAYWKSLGTPLDEDLSEDQAAGMGTGQALPGGEQVQGPPPGSTFGPTPMGQGQVPGIEQAYQPQPMPMGQMPPTPGMMPGMVPNPTTMAPSQLPPLMAPPGENQVIPPFPISPDQMQLPVSVPGGRPGPYPADPMQQPGTFSKVAAKIDFLERQPGFAQTSEGQAALHLLRHRYPKEGDPVFPLLMREVRRGMDTGGQDGLLISPTYLQHHQQAATDPSYYDILNGDRPDAYLWRNREGQMDPIQPGMIQNMGKMLRWMKANNHPIPNLDSKKSRLGDLEALYLQWKAKYGDRPDYGTVTHEFPDGWTMRTLNNETELFDEGEEMNHCGAKYAPLVAAGTHQVFSLRDPQNVAHASVVFRPDEHAIEDIRGRHNLAPNDQYTEYLKAWLPTLGDVAISGHPHPQAPPIPEVAKFGLPIVGPEAERQRYARVSAQEFVQGMAARLNEATLGQTEGREGATDAGEWREIPQNAQVEVRDQDPTTGWVEIIYPLRGGPMTSYHIRCFVEPEKLTPMPGRSSPFQNPRGRR